jgi:hypothetical protein
MTKTFENAKAIGYADLLEKIKAANLTEYGLCPAPLADNIYAACAKEGDAYVHAGLNNADVDGALLGLLKADPDAVFSGIAVAGLLTGAAAKFMYLPAAETELAAELIHGPQGVDDQCDAAGVHECHGAEVQLAIAGQVDADLLGDGLHRLAGAVVVDLPGEQDGQALILEQTGESQVGFLLCRYR